MYVYKNKLNSINYVIELLYNRRVRSKITVIRISLQNVELLTDYIKLLSVYFQINFSFILNVFKFVYF